MHEPLKILMAQINPTVGAITANREKIISIIKAQQEAHDLIIFPELALSGYPPEDLVYRKDFFDHINVAINAIQSQVTDCHVIVGHPTLINDNCYNSASIFHQQKQIHLYHKQHLPNYGVFDEKRYFKAGHQTECLFKIKNYQLALLICEDIWEVTPLDSLKSKHLDALCVINASPFDYQKYELRENLLKPFAKRGIATFYVNQVGGQDELVFDGQSFALDHHGITTARMPAFQEDLQTVLFSSHYIQGSVCPLLEENTLIYQALVFGLRDYIEKNHFPGVLLGLSGGIDSALTLAIAVDALGASRVHAVLMPSRYTATMSIEDAVKQLETMHVSYTSLPIEPIFNATLDTLAPSFQGRAVDTTEENIQARIRGMLLMALSNKMGNMVMTTSNKSETAVGYATLYGDMCGGFGVLKDVLKTKVYQLAEYRNQLSSVIPQRVLTRSPSAELAPNQTDQDNLPDYVILDAIINDYLEHNASADEIINKGYDAEIVLNVIRLIQRNEYKRRQAAPGIKITPRAFGRDWRYPITNGFYSQLLQNKAKSIT